MNERFDFADRLVARNQTGNNEAWTLSEVADFDRYTLNGTATSRTHGNAHEISTVGSNTLTHDNRGNLTQDESGRLFAWDADGMLKSVDVNADSTVDLTYAYDALGRRVSRTAGGSTLVFCSLRHDTIGEYTSGASASSPQRTYVHGQRIDESIAMLSGSNTYYYHTDASTSIRALTDGSGSLTELYNYTSYGKPTILNPSLTTQTASAVSNRYLFTAREWDDALTNSSTQQTGSYYFRARWLSPTLGRFISRDPLNYVDGPGLYRAYFVPKWRDPRGKDVWIETPNRWADCINEFVLQCEMRIANQRGNSASHLA